MGFLSDIVDRVEVQIPEPEPCSIEECGSPAHQKGWCERHYFRWYRHGDPLLTLAPKARPRKEYARRVMHGHPLAQANGTVMVHRAVLYASIGPGEHACHWCGKSVEWLVDLVVDHLDWDTMNNNLDNLVPSCNRCNLDRAEPEPTCNL